MISSVEARHESEHRGKQERFCKIGRSISDLAINRDSLRSIEQGSPMMGVLPFDRYLEVGGVPRELPTE